jgi:hypothetical protein
VSSTSPDKPPGSAERADAGTATGARARTIDENPFFVLDLAVDVAPAEIERTARRLLAELEIGRSAARVYASPRGLLPRTPELVRAAAAELRDPARRLAHELRARVPVRAEAVVAPAALPWPVAARALGLRTRSRS